MTSDTTISIAYGNIVETLTVTPVWDYELWKPTLAFTGKDNDNICVWAKKIK